MILQKVHVFLLPELVFLIPLDKLIKKYGVPDLIKIDIEGGELECLSSLTQKTPMITFEWASETKNIAYNCLIHVQRLGFHNFFVQRGDDFLFRPHMFYDIKKCIDIIKNSNAQKHWGMIWTKGSLG
jgi:hypothetical protein